MDWLTEEWARQTYRAAWREYVRANTSKDPTTFCAGFIARAAVKKVVEWLEEDCTEHTPPLYAATYPVDRASCAECWEALKAAGGSEYSSEALREMTK